MDLLEVAYAVVNSLSISTKQGGAIVGMLPCRLGLVLRHGEAKGDPNNSKARQGS